MTGSLFCSAGYFGYRLLLDGEPAVWNRFVPVSVLIGIGVGSTIATWSSAGLADVEPAKSGTSNAMIRTAQQVFYGISASQHLSISASQHLSISVPIAIISRGTGDIDVANYHLAWWFVGGCYLVNAVVVAVTFPSGSSQQRAQQTFAP
jgi:hypothetical protein